ncbi:hypothetical protein FW774_05945 [Pedobacter sp. BS3]|uniref:hypothetical protein n=1 Tax=Pedobacter sp. BS3 TaxID=2567937 RepID=UPI0011EBE070|nr:hypothetical protein [Pedobacter sp. BS3]TZF84529.1 hypothetical protein FW774_05945 [Pedobacter sp. BS3]
MSKARFTEKDLHNLGFIECEPGHFCPSGRVPGISSTERKVSKTVRKRPKTVTKISKNVTKVDLFVRLVEQELGIILVPEYEFHPERHWRFDYADPDRKIAIEQEGGIWRKGGGAHSRPKNILRDMDKYTQAALLGWKVIRRTPNQLATTETLQLIKQAIQ